MIYLDEMFLFNAVMDYIILSLVNRICLSCAKRYRLFIAACAGGVLSCIGYIMRLSFVSGLMFALFCAAVCFGFKAKCMLLTVIISSCYGGILEVMSNIVGINAVNGFGYIDISLALVLVLSIIIYIPIKISFFIYNKKNAERYCDALILTGEGGVQAKLLIDSGCTLSCENNPVLLVSRRTFKFEGNIPVKYSSVGGDGVIMCSYCTAFIGEKFFGKVAVGNIDIESSEYQGIFPMYAFGL